MTEVIPTEFLPRSWSRDDPKNYLNQASTPQKYFNGKDCTELNIFAKNSFTGKCDYMSRYFLSSEIVITDSIFAAIATSLELKDTRRGTVINYYTKLYGEALVGVNVAAAKFLTGKSKELIVDAGMEAYRNDLCTIIPMPFGGPLGVNLHKNLVLAIIWYAVGKYVGDE